MHLVVPPASEFLRTVRLVAADAAGRAGCSIDEVEDFRIAVDELCHRLMTATDHFVHISLTTFEDHVVGRGSARARSRSARVELEEVSAMIVGATADDYELGASEGELVFEAVKRARHLHPDATDRRMVGHRR